MWKFLIFCATSLYQVEANIGQELSKTMKCEIQLILHITECIKNISDTELQFRPTVIVDTQNVNNKTKSNMFLKRMVNKLMEVQIPTIIVTKSIDDTLLDNVLVEKDFVVDKKYVLHIITVIYFDNCENVTTFNFKAINREIKYLFVIAGSASNSINKLLEIRNFVYEYDITFVFLNVCEDEIKLYTFFTKYDGNTCKLMYDKYLHINTCIKGKLQTKVVFPLKNLNINFNKCPLRVGMAALYPFSEVKNKETLQTYDHINETRGSDMEIMKIVAEHVNATLDVYYIYRKQENPYVNSVFLNFLLNGSLDLCAGGLYRMYGDIVEYSGIYKSQAVLWIYSAEREARSWENLTANMHDLYMFILFYAGYSVAWYLICAFDGDGVSFGDTLLYGWGALVGGTQFNKARTIKQKILNLAHLVIRIFLAAYVSIHMFSFLTIMEPGEAILTDDELMNSGRPAFLENSAKFFINDKRYLDFAKTSKECVSFKDCTDKTLQYNGMTIILQGNFYLFQSTTGVNGDARILKVDEHILTVYNEIILRKDSPLVIEFQDVIQKLFEGGITEHLYAKAVGLVVIDKANTLNCNMLKPSYSCQAGCTITLSQFAGVFYFWIFGCMAACAAFIIELGCKR